MNNTTTRTEEVAARVRKLLKDEGYKGTQIAERLGVSEGQVSRLLSGKSAFKFDHLVTLGQMLGVNPKTFLGLTVSEADEVYVTVAEAAAEARRHPETIRKAIHSGGLPSTQRVPGGRHLIKRSDLDAWIAGVR